MTLSPTLEPRAAPAAPSRSEQPATTAELYACPMHPEVTSKLLAFAYAVRRFDPDGARDLATESVEVSTMS
ncbi:MAG TPA: hypothetical protein VK447_18400 [Myxococcaceae bacterium]|nr:hypothetical protein [Myxococcaceae bacterium]